MKVSLLVRNTVHSEIRSHFLFKGKRMADHRAPSPAVQKQRVAVHRDVSRALRRSISGLSPRHVLDVGTGYGASVELLARRFGGMGRIWSIDVSAEVIRSVREMLKSKGLGESVFLKKGKAEQMPFRAGRFDLVVSLLSLHHFSNPLEALREMARVTSHGGKVIVADWKPTKSPVTPHSAKDIPSPTFVERKLRLLGWSTTLKEGRYWYLVEASKGQSKPLQNR
ncbi:MAG: class I SAM-dependent methyltransferase [Candidatus Bathyarchaeia archaeon]